MSADLRPSELCRGLLRAMEASEGRRQRRRRDTTPDAIGFALRKTLLESAVAADPAPEDFEAWLLGRCHEPGAPSGPLRALAKEVFDEWRLARASPDFRAWLERGAPSEGASEDEDEDEDVAEPSPGHGTGPRTSPEVLVLTGPCGVGKSTVAFECMEILERAGVPCAMVDGELAYFHPKPPGDRHGYAVAEAGLRALWPVYRAAGIDRLLLGRVVEDEEQLAIVVRAVPGARIRLMRLVAGPETIGRRLRGRELGSALEWHLGRSAEIASAVLGEPVDAERSVGEIAREVLLRAGWLPADPPGSGP